MRLSDGPRTGKPLVGAWLHGRAKGATCRICMETEPAGSLFSPCRCRGTMKYVHRECLQRWRSTSTNQQSFYRCDQCHCRYSSACVGTDDWLRRAGISFPAVTLAASASIAAAVCVVFGVLVLRSASLPVLGGGTVLLFMAASVMISSFEVGFGSVSVYGLNFQ